jgi:lambda repressor-like predicted transcriptional regulator
VKHTAIIVALNKQGLTLEVWASNNGYKASLVYTALNRWVNRYSSHPRGKTYDILIALSIQIGKPVSPVISHEVRSILRDASQKRKGK